MQYLVFLTQAAAETSERTIFERGAAIAAMNGYPVDEKGIVGRTPAGELMMSGARTTHWYPPRQRVDGKWVVLHPKHHPAAREAAWLAFVLDGLLAPSEEESPTWWPASAEP